MRTPSGHADRAGREEAAMSDPAGVGPLRREAQTEPSMGPSQRRNAIIEMVIAAGSVRIEDLPDADGAGRDDHFDDRVAPLARPHGWFGLRFPSQRSDAGWIIHGGFLPSCSVSTAGQGAYGAPA